MRKLQRDSYRELRLVGLAAFLKRTRWMQVFGFPNSIVSFASCNVSLFPRLFRVWTLFRLVSLRTVDD